MPSKIIKSYCRDCSKETNHDVISEHSESNRGDYAFDLRYQIIRCRGCDTNSFRKVFIDIESAFPIDDDRWDVPEDITVYPKAIEWHREVSGIYELPIVVRLIYSETLLALTEDAKVLAGLGLRGTVEAVCNDLKITGRNLEVRINKLAVAGYISKKDAERLHGIRFMGNDAAHDIKPPKDKSLKVALQIVEHLVSSVYILENMAEGYIDTTTSKYEVFEEMLDKKIKLYNSGDEFPIAQFLGKDLRRVKESMTNLEQELVNKINNGGYQKLSVGKIDHYKGSRDELQHFVVS